MTQCYFINLSIGLDMEFYWHEYNHLCKHL